MRVSWLNLHQWIPQRDVRKLIYALLNEHDRYIVTIAHGGMEIYHPHNIICHFASHGYLALLKWCASSMNRFQIGKCALEDAVGRGHLNVVKWIHEQNLLAYWEWDASLPTIAAISNQPHVLKWLRSNTSCAFTSLTTEEVARTGNLQMLRILREELKCPWDVYTCIYAARCGHLPMLVYAIHNGCPFNRTECLKSEFTHVVEWIVLHHPS